MQQPSSARMTQTTRPVSVGSQVAVTAGGCRRVVVTPLVSASGAVTVPTQTENHIRILVRM